MSSLILLPPLILITLLFAKAGPSPQKQKQSIRPTENVTSTNSNTNSNNNNDGRRQRWVWGQRSNNKQKKKRHWPYWCRYIAWCLTALAIAAAAFFTILYSFEFGGEKSRAWLVAFFLSFFQSVLLLQPVKVGRFLLYINVC